MSRIGKKPIPIPKEVNISLKDDIINVKGPKGALDLKIIQEVEVETNENEILVKVGDDSKQSRAYHGLVRALIANMVNGVTVGFSRELEIIGVGYRAELSGRTATFHLGYSHPVVYDLPEGIDAKIDKTRITLSGIDKDLLGKTAAKVRSFRKPEPYKGKGIKYADEVIKRKAGKTGAK